ncbi:Hypothetical predicted protein [Scomber scombrus]|uniref:Uncharacterized protein n=1 Tax=Scomber scombrus TaxID=13677 RepID=A0AAV1PPX0_SCOSC
MRILLPSSSCSFKEWGSSFFVHPRVPTKLVFLACKTVASFRNGAPYSMCYFWTSAASKTFDARFIRLIPHALNTFTLGFGGEQLLIYSDVGTSLVAGYAVLNKLTPSGRHQSKLVIL